MREIIVTADPKTGATRIETRGFRGSACRRATQGLKDLLGITVESDEDTPEALQSEEAEAEVANEQA